MEFVGELSTKLNVVFVVVFVIVLLVIVAFVVVFVIVKSQLVEKLFRLYPDAHVIQINNVSQTSQFVILHCG